MLPSLLYPQHPRQGLAPTWFWEYQSRWRKRSPQVLIISSSFPMQDSHVFTNFGKGIRYAPFEYGRDTHSWEGHCSAPVTHSRTRLS